MSLFPHRINTTGVNVTSIHQTPPARFWIVGGKTRSVKPNRIKSFVALREILLLTPQLSQEPSGMSTPQKPKNIKSVALNETRTPSFIAFALFSRAATMADKPLWTFFFWVSILRKFVLAQVGKSLQTCLSNCYAFQL